MLLCTASTLRHKAQPSHDPAARLIKCSQKRQSMTQATQTRADNKRSQTYSIVRVCACLLSLAAILVRFYLPEKSQTLVPSGSVYPAIFDYRDGGTGSIATWKDEQNGDWMCTLPTSDGTYSCGYSLSWGGEYDEGIDFSVYKALRLKVTYNGPAKRIRVFMRNFNPAYSHPNDGNSAKFMSTMVRTKDLSQTITLPFSDFSVIDWWLSAYDVPREYTGVEFDNIVTTGFDHVFAGEHHMQVESIELIGEWVSAENLYLSLLLIWMTVLIWEAVSRIHWLQKKALDEESKLHELLNDYQQLETEKQKYEQISHRDALTQALNRTGLSQRIEELFNSATTPPQITLMVIDIDLFKEINDTFGHGVGDTTLQKVVNTIHSNMRSEDILGRWGGEEFVLITQTNTLTNALHVANKMRQRIAEYDFKLPDKRKLTISIGLTLSQPGDRFEDMFKRADVALYRAKHTGRNCVKTEDSQTPLNLAGKTAQDIEQEWDKLVKEDEKGSQADP